MPTLTAAVGPYDASTFVEDNYATYPELPDGAIYYQPSMYWDVTGAGTVHGQDVAVGDKLFVTQGHGRRYGEHAYDYWIFGGIADSDWPVEHVYFMRWDSSPGPPDVDPYPNAGCPFTPGHAAGGNWAPGWKIVIEAFYNALLGSRTYGDDTYADDVYGDVDNGGEAGWVDITHPSYSIVTGDGTREGIQHVVVAEAVVDLIDDTGDWLDFAEPGIWFQPQPGQQMRVGFLDPEFRYRPVFTGQIERVEDVHDELPRVVSLRGFGQLMDLAVDVLGWQRPSEYLSQRFDALVDEAGWRWGSGELEFPGNITLAADTAPRDVVVRDELDRTVQSAGWFLDSDRRGRMRLRTWPHEPQAPTIEVVDCDPTEGTPASFDPSSGVVTTDDPVGDDPGELEVVADPTDAAAYYVIDGGELTVGVDGDDVAYPGELASWQISAVNRATVCFPAGTGHELSTPDAAPLHIAGDLELVARLQLTPWDDAGDVELVGRWNGPPDNSYSLGIALGFPVLRLSYDGTTDVSAVATDPVAFTSGEWGWLKATYDHDTGTVQFFTAPDELAEPTSWTQLGIDVGVS